MSKQSFRHVIVTNSVAVPAADANTTALVAGQVGVFEVPSYRNKLDFNTINRVQIFQGTPDFPVAALAGVPNFNRRTIEFNKLAIKAAKLSVPVSAQNRIVVLGFDTTAAATANLILKNGGAKKSVWITLSGFPVNQETGHTQGWTKRFDIESNPSGDPATNFSQEAIVDDLIAQINADPNFAKYLNLTKNTGGAAQAGLQISTNSVKFARPTKYQYGIASYEAQVVHVEINTWSPDYNEAYVQDSGEWPVVEKQALRYAQGGGEYVRELEKRSLSYELEEFSCDPALLDAYGYDFNAVTTTNYDEYQLWVEQDPIKTEGFGKVENSHILSVFVPAGTGRSAGQIGTVLNNLVVDAGLPALF